MSGEDHGPDGSKLLDADGVWRPREAWRSGVDEFNRGRYWHAHEFWEKGWNRLPSPERESLQALIQAAAVFHLIEKGRFRPARSLAESALRKLENVQAAGGLPRGKPYVEIFGVEKVLRDLLSREGLALSDLSDARKLRARLILC